MTFGISHRGTRQGDMRYVDINIFAILGRLDINILVVWKGWKYTWSMSNSKPSIKVCWPPLYFMSISNPPKLQYVYIHTSQIILWLIPNPLYYAFLDYFFLRKLCLFPKVFFQPSIYVYFHMAISKLSFFRQLWPFPYAVLHRPYKTNIKIINVMLFWEIWPFIKFAAIKLPKEMRSS